MIRFTNVIDETKTRQSTLKHGVLLSIIVLSGLFVMPLIIGSFGPASLESSHTVEITIESLTSDPEHYNGTIVLSYGEVSENITLWDPEDPDVPSGYVIFPFLRLTSALDYLFAYHMNSGDRVGPHMMNSMEETTLYNIDGALMISFIPVQYIGSP